MRGILQKHLRVLGIVFVLLQSYYVYAQDRISGTVVDAEGKVPLAGATISTTSKPSTSVNADSFGKFTITVANGATLKITMTGYEPLTVAAKQGMTVEMTAGSIGLNETVIVGYSKQKRELLSGSIASVKFTETDTEIPTTSVGNLLAGRMPGLYVSTPSGIPGAQPGLRIRTGSTFSNTGTVPTLYVIDGKVTSDAAEFNNLSPNEIDEVTILKDAATTAAYGSRAAGGVVLVTTKRGKAGKASVNYSVNTGKDYRGKNMELTNIMEWGDIYHRITGAADNLWTEGAKAYFKDTDFGGGKGYGFNALKDVYVDPSITTHNVSASGGTDKVQYFMGGSFVNQETFIKNTFEKKYNVRANITANLTKDVEVFAGLSLNNNKFNQPEGDWSGDMFPKLLVWQPYMPSFNNAGLPAYYFWITNKPAEANGMVGYNNREAIKTVINLNATYKAPFLEGLSAKVGYIKSYTNTNQKIYSHPFTYYELKQIEPAIWDLDGPPVGKTLSQHSKYIEKLSAWNQEDQLNFQVNFDRTFGQHHVNAALVYERQERSGDGIDASITGFPIYQTDQWWASTGGSGIVNGAATKAVSNTYGFEVTTGRKSYVGQFAYDYAGKYIATFTSRYDGSVNFAPDKRWGFFPAASAAWIVSKENFFKNIKAIESLKLRASIGLTGNDNVSRWQYEDSYVSGSSAFFGEPAALNPGIQYGVFPNPNITWEKYKNKNIGIDISFLKHFTATAEYWHNLTYDILSAKIQSTPPTFSRPLPAVNYGKMKADGIDLSLNYANRIGEFNFNVGANFTYGDSWYVVRDQNITYDYQDLLKPGRSANYITGYTVDKLLRTQADVDALLAAKPGYTFGGIVPKPGQFAYKDFNGDNKIDNNDIQVLSNSNNAKVFGLNLNAEWKGISINANFNGSFGYKKSFNDLSGGVEWNRMWRPWHNESWTPENPTNSWLPYRYSANDGVRGVNTSGSDFWLADASFVRLKFLNVAYNVPQKLYKKYVNNVRFYVSGSNLFVISKFNKKFYDPEMGGGTSFPIVKSYNAGVSVTF